MCILLSLGSVINLLSSTDRGAVLLAGRQKDSALLYTALLHHQIIAVLGPWFPCPPAGSIIYTYMIQYIHM